MIEKLKEILGLITGYKQKYESAKAELDKAKATIAEGEVIADKILAIVRGWNGTTHRKIERSKRYPGSIKSSSPSS